MTGPQAPSDAPTFEQTIDTQCETLGQPAALLADAGFASGEPVGALEARGIKALAAVSRADKYRVYDFRPPRPDAPPPPEPKAEWLLVPLAYNCKHLFNLATP